MTKDLVLSLDFGTQSLRAVLFEPDGTVVGVERVAYEPYYSAAPGLAEKDPEEYWQAVCEAVPRLMARGDDVRERLAGVAVTSLRDTAVNLGKDGEVLRPAIVWLDQRRARGVPAIPVMTRAALRVIGMLEPVQIIYRKSKSNWLRQNEPETWEKTHKYVQVSGFIHHRLTGLFHDSVASQIGHIPFDYQKQQWMDDSNFRQKLFNVEREKLPALVEPGGLVGEVRPQAARETGLPQGLPVYAAGSDKGCETIGSGCLSETCANISLGTSATLQTLTPRYMEVIRFLPSYPAVVPGHFNPEIQIYRGYWLISWFKREFAQKECMEAQRLGVSPESLLNQRLDQVPAGCRGLILQPLWNPGVLQSRARGAVIGFGDAHDHAHLYRAIIEGINFALMEGLESLERRGKTRIETLTVAGGGSQSSAICQITADMMNRPVVRPANVEASSVGAAAAAFAGAGIHSNVVDAIRAMVRPGVTFEPVPANARLYRELYQRVYKGMYPALKGMYREIQEITGYPEM